jgi:intracellular multiplication protein IcmO
MARKIPMRGLAAGDEQDPRHLLRDTRTLGQATEDFFSNASYVAVVLVTMAGSAIVIPGLNDLVFVCGLLIFWYTYTRKITLPFRMPLRAGVLDYNDIRPGSTKPNKARGITYFGNDLENGEELWFTNDDMRTHVLIFGSTGSGKTETLISLSYNSLVQGSGFIYIDGKGDNTLYGKIFSMARSMGREDDMLVINFMTGARDIVGPQAKRLSNTMNPFSVGSSSMLAQLVVSMMDSSSASPDGDMWKGRAIAFVEALMKILVYARDQEMVLLDANVIRKYFTLDRLEAMVADKVLIRDGQEPCSIADAPDVVVEPISNYLDTLPGYDKTKKGKQVSQVLEQHGFITMQLTRVFTSLADTYGHILRTDLAEVDVKDVVLNRRILVVLLPALEKSPEELSNLGKVVVASIKAMMASGLGEDVEGEYRDVIQRKPTNAPTPYVCIMDEYGYYAVPGFAVVPAQARSLGFCAIFAGQDLPAFQKASKEEAASIGANTNIKICMKLEDPTETWEFFSKTAGEAYVTKVDHFQTRPQSLTNSYLDTRSASFEKRARIDLLDLKEQTEGEAHLFFKSRVIRYRTFYANPKNTTALRVNQSIKVRVPKTRELIEFNNAMVRFRECVEQGDIIPSKPIDSSEINLIAQSLVENDFLSPIERGVHALLDYHGNTKPRVVKVQEEKLPPEELNIFTKMRLTDKLQAVICVSELGEFSEPILDKQILLAKLETIERSSGKPEQHARSIAEEIVKDMRVATHYPPDMTNQPQPEDLVAVVKLVITRIQEERAKKESESTS